jgi:radical SAM protein with 4Fe4S-binding SPASM domain
MINGMPYVQFYPTLRCNDSCHFCFNKGLPATKDVTISDFKKIASVLQASGVCCIDILGGEPTLHAGLMPLLDIITMHRMKCNLSSNGANTHVLTSLSEQFDKEFLRIGISLHSPDVSEELHHYILRHRPVLKSVLTKTAGIPESCRRYVGLPGIEYFLLYMDAVDDHDLECSMPFYRFTSELLRLKKIHKGLDGVFCGGFVPDEEAYPVLASVRCPAGTTKLSIAADGSVYPCYLFFRHKEFEVGNILRDDFQRILHSPILNYFRTFSGNTCPETGCPLFASCHGGCPAMSYLFFHDLAAPDPRCTGKHE